MDGGDPDHRSRLLADIEFGQDGFLFYRGDASFEQICDDAVFSTAATRNLLAVVTRRFTWCARLGIPYFLLITPEKQVVYDDMLPPGRRISPRRPAARLLAEAEPALRPFLIYPAEDLRRGRSTAPTYFKTDSHWSRWGAYVGYRTLLDRLHARFRDMPGVRMRPATAEDELVMTPEHHTGDLGVRLEPEPLETFQEVQPRAPLAFRKRVLNRSFSDGQAEVWSNDDAALPRAVVFRSSNATHLLDPFLVAHFSRLVAIAGARTMYHALVLSERPDCVITEVPERYLATPAPSRGRGALEPFCDFGLAQFTAATGLSLPLL